MLIVQSTPFSMGVRLSGDSKQLNNLGDRFIHVANTHSQAAVGQIIANFGFNLKQYSHSKPIKPTYTIRISWPHLLYLLHILQNINPSLSELSTEKEALTILCYQASEQLCKLQAECNMPISHYLDPGLGLYQGECIESLLLMTELAFVRHTPIGDRMNFLGTCMDMLNPSAWIHHDTLAFVKSIAHDSRSLHILKSDLADDLSQKRW